MEPEAHDIAESNIDGKEESGYVKNRHYILFGIILVVLLVIYWVQVRSSRITQMSTGYVPMFDGLKVEEVSNVQAFRPPDPEKGVILDREGDLWVVSNKFNVKADQKRVSTLLDDVRKLKGELRTSDPGNFPVFQLEKEKALHLIFFDGKGKQLAHLLVGKKGEQGRTCFVRKVDEDNVYSVDKNLVSTFQIWEVGQQPPINRWCDLFVKQVEDWSKVVGLTMYLPKQSIVFEKSERKVGDGETKKQWAKIKPSEGPVIAHKDILPIVNSLLGLKGEDVIDPSKKESLGLESAEYRALVTLENGESHELLFTIKDNLYYAMVKGGKDIFLIPKSSFEKSVIKINELMKGKAKDKTVSKPSKK